MEIAEVCLAQPLSIFHLERICKPFLWDDDSVFCVRMAPKRHYLWRSCKFLDHLDTCIDVRLVRFLMNDYEML